MKNSFISFLFGLIIGAGGFWYFTEGQKSESVQRAQEKVASGAEHMKDAISEKVGELNWRSEDIKEELTRTGKVVRKKAQEVGAKVVDATANARTTAAIKAKLALDPDLSVLTISVDTTDGVVTLSGTVSEYEYIAKAMRLAMETDGVREVTSTLHVKQSK
ncbi:MAG: BON domain-containing protein [Verrucomicrobiota bacterium]